MGLAPRDKLMLDMTTASRRSSKLVPLVGTTSEVTTPPGDTTDRRTLVLLRIPSAVCSAGTTIATRVSVNSRSMTSSATAIEAASHSPSRWYRSNTLNGEPSLSSLTLTYSLKWRGDGYAARPTQS